MVNPKLDEILYLNNRLIDCKINFPNDIDRLKQIKKEMFESIKSLIENRTK